MRNFNVSQQFADIQKAAIEATREIFPVEGRTQSVRLKDVWVDDNIGSNNFSAQAKVKAREGTYGVPVYASLELVENASGKVLDANKKIRLFMLPKITGRFSYIVKGNEYQVHNQLRLKPGVYTLRKQNGELKTQVNLAKGKNFDIVFNEKKGLFYISKVGGGQANIPLGPVLEHLGISHQAMDKAWGAKLGAANRVKDPKVEERLKNAFGVRQGSLKDYLSNTEISPETTKAALGQAFSKVDGSMLLASAKDLLQTHLGKKEPTDRDSLEYKELHSVEDYLKERLVKNKSTLARKIRRSVDSRSKLTQIVNPGAFNSTIESFFTQDDKSATPEQTNPLEMLTGQYKATIMGTGGIKQEHAITNDMREVHPSHYGFMDPVHTPESKRIGANLHLPLGAVKDGKELKTLVLDKKGKMAALTPKEAFTKKIIMPGQKGNKVKALYKGETITINRKDGDYETPSSRALFSWSTNLVPYLPSNQGNRAMMASKMLEQAISLKNREAPLVQVGTGSQESMEEQVGKTVAAVAPGDGIVTSVSKDAINIKTKDGLKRVDLYDNFALNRKSFLHHEAKVKKGDRVKKGQVLADSNFTKDGTLALGTNLKAAYLPYKGLNFEDGIVITDSAAEKLTSEHIHKKHIDTDQNTILNLNTFKSVYPNALSTENLAKLDESGVIKKGAKIHNNEAIVAALRKSEASPELALVRKQLSERPRNSSLIWPFEDSGEVLEVRRTAKRVTVLIRTEEKAKIGDKLSGRMGNKGIITKIIPDSHAPKGKDGEAVDILLNPHGVISRINIGQIYESAAGKAAKKKGKPHKVQNFTGENYLKSTKKLLSEAKVDDKEELFDPESGKSLGKVHVGNPYILKLFKQSTANFSARQGGPGHPYDINLQPVKAGGEEGAKSLDLLSMYSMLSHGARANLREMSSIKSNQNDEFWKALKSGQQLPPPKTPFVYDKFMEYLKASGIDTKKDGSKITLAPLTDKQVAGMSRMEIKDPRFYNAKDMKTVKRGFLDEAKLGGFKGEAWSHIELKEPVINPVFETAVRKLTGLGKKFDDVMEGKLYLDKEGKWNTDGKGVTGGAAVEKLLKKVDVDEQIKALTRKATGKKPPKGAQLDSLNKQLRYLKNLKRTGLRPEEAYIRRKVPVIPPKYRPIYPLPDGNMMNSDANFLYGNVGVLNSMMKLPVMDLLPEDDKSEIRKEMYDHVKGVSGLTDLNIKGRVRDGFISEIKGGSGGQPKEGFFINKVLSKKQDYAGRGTIIPEPDLGVDEVALPEKMAWKLFEPFVVRELKSHGKSPLQAEQEIKNRTDLARAALNIVMKDRKVLLNRAPSLHKFSIMGFRPKITDGKAIKIPPLVVEGFNADFDGDTMTVHVPVSDEANREAESLMPSRNLYKPGTGKLMLTPSQEAQVGIFYLSKTPAGRAKLNKIVPKKYEVKGVLNKKATRDLLQKMSKDLDGGQFANVVEKLKSSGEDQAYDMGFTLGINDLAQFGESRDKLVQAVGTRVRKAKGDQRALSSVSQDAQKLVDAMISKKLKGKNNPLFDMVESGARGSGSQLRQIMATPLLVTDSRQRIVPSVIAKSYTEGLDMGDYWTSMYGARRGMMDRALQTSLPGAFSKDIMATTINNTISDDDCGVKKGLVLKVTDPDVLGRYLAKDQAGFSRNTLVDAKVVSAVKKKRIQTLEVRSPLECLAAKGTCAKCYGLDEHGALPSIGDNVGAKAGQTISEPLVQMVMNCSEGNITDHNNNMGAFEDLYDSLAADEKFDGHCYFKDTDLKIKDMGEDVRVPVIQTHMPDDDMFFIKTKTGHTLLVQGNHPVWVYDEEGVACEKLARDVTAEDRMAVDRSSLEGAEEAPLPGYLLGLYFAEGSTRYGNGTERYKDTPVATVITQGDRVPENQIKSKVMGLIKERGIEGGRAYPHDVQIYSPRFARCLADVVRGRVAWKKRFQPGFNKWRDEDMLDILAGWIDGDGTVYNKHGTTVAQIYTCSYVGLQQLEVMCHKLGIRFTPQVVSKQPLQKRPQFVAQLRFPDNRIVSRSIKMQEIDFSPGKYSVKHEALEPVTYTKRLWRWELPVWDVKTETRGFTCGMLRNHNTFHTGGTAGSGADAGGFRRIEQLLHLPKVVAGAAPLAPVTGKVEKIQKGLAGGYDVWVGKRKEHVPHGRKLKVSQGQQVAKGDPLSDGAVKPQDLVKHKGMANAQRYIVDELQKAYHSQNVPIQKKVFETVVRSSGNTTQVLNNPGDSDYVPGDIIPYTVARNHNKNLLTSLKVEEAVGTKLAKGYGPFRKGHAIADKDVKLLKVLGHKEVEVERDAIQHAPTLKGITSMPLLRKDWMAALGYRNLAKALTEGAGQGWSTDLESHHPIPAFARGTEFGKNKGGKY